MLTGHYGANVLQPVETELKRETRTQRNALMSMRHSRAIKVLAQVYTVAMMAAQIL